MQFRVNAHSQGDCTVIRRTATIALLLCLLAPAGLADDDIDKAVRDLKNKKYGAYWDRLKACKLLSRKDSEEAALALKIALADKDAAVQEEAVMAYARMRDEGAKKVLWNTLLLRDRNPLVRANAAWAIRMSGSMGKDAEKQLIRALADRHGLVRSQAARAIAALELEGAGDALIKLLKDSDWRAAADKLRAVALLKLDGAKAKVIKATKGGHPVVRAEAYQTLAVLDSNALAPLVEKAAKDSKAQARMGLLYALLLVPSEVAFPAAAKLVADKDWRVRTCAIDVLHKIREKRCIGPMIKQMVKEKGRLRADFAKALESLTGQDLGYQGKTWQSWWKAAKASFKMPKEAKKDGKKKNDGSIATFFGIPILSNAVVFAIDFSGSMKTELTKGRYAKQRKLKIDIAFEQLEQALKRFVPKQAFSAIHVSTEATAKKKRFLTPRLVPATPSNRYKAMIGIKAIWKVLAPIKRGRGDFYDAMLEGANRLKGDTLLLLSDGNPSFGMYVKPVNFVEEWGRFNKYRRIVVHTILIGYSSDGKKLCKQLAEQTGGVFEDLTAEPRKKKKKRKKR